MPKQKTWLVTLVILAVLIVDQAVKFWIKTNMYIGEEFYILNQSWARIHFIENPGMAFGMEFGGSFGKLALSLFRIVAVVALSYYLVKLVKSKAGNGLLVCFALILAGAIGNIIDSAFYGILFSKSTPMNLAEFLPEDGGYAPFLKGWVVDMFYFPLYEGNWPEWLGGGRLEFFKPVFNVADASISVGVIAILLFQRSFFATRTPAEQEIQAAERQQEATETTSGVAIIENADSTEPTEPAA